MISRCYNLLLHTALGVRFSDPQCGLKAIRPDKASELLPQVRDGSWFFRHRASRAGRARCGPAFHEVPVDWTDGHSRVDVMTSGIADLPGIVRLAGGAQLARFLLVGVASTAAPGGQPGTPQRWFLLRQASSRA